MIEILAGSASLTAAGMPCRINAGTAVTVNSNQRPFGVVTVPGESGDPLSVAVMGSGLVVKAQLTANASKGDALIADNPGFAPFTSVAANHLEYVSAIALEDGDAGDLVEALLVTPTLVIDPSA